MSNAITSIKIIIGYIIDEMKTWPERTRNYWRFDNPAHLSAGTIAQKQSDERWARYAASDEGKRRLGGSR